MVKIPLALIPIPWMFAILLTWGVVVQIKIRFPDAIETNLDWFIRRRNMLGITYLVQLILGLIGSPIWVSMIFAYEVLRRVPGALRWLFSRPTESGGQ